MGTLERRQFQSSLDKLELSYWRAGPDDVSERSLVLLHGGASNHSRWSEFVERSDLRVTWNILVPDIRGNAHSMTRSKVNLSAWCNDLNDLLAAENKATTVLVGHSLGAHLALHFAAQYPEKVAGLVLLDPTLNPNLTGKAAMVRRHGWLVKSLVKAVLAMNFLGLRRRSFPIKDLQALDKETRVAIEQADSFAEIAERYSALGPILSVLPIANYLRQALAMVEPLPPLEQLKMPTLLLLSGATTMGSFAANRAQAQRLADHQLSVIHANHWPLTEAPDETRQAICAWLSQTWPN